MAKKPLPPHSGEYKKTALMCIDFVKNIYKKKSAELSNFIYLKN